MSASPERIMEQTVELAMSSGEAGSSWLGADDATGAAVTAVGQFASEARPLGIAKHSVSMESVFAVSSGEFPIEVVEARPSVVAKYSAATAVSSNNREVCWCG